MSAQRPKINLTIGIADSSEKVLRRNGASRPAWVIGLVAKLRGGLTVPREVETILQERRDVMRKTIPLLDMLMVCRIQRRGR
jgi:hypothetical protein